MVFWRIFNKSIVKITIHTCIADIPAKDWNALVQDNNPFLRHEFLLALEQHHCVGKAFGWLPRHVALYEADALVAAMPLYEKYNSYGEFVFDHAWAEAYQQAGLAYFPKLISSIPYTPASGQRLLIAAERFEQLAPILLKTALEFAKQEKYSGLHFLFPLAEQQDWLQQQEQGFFARHDCQFHWHNQNYQCFDDFLAKLTAKKRKNIRQERRRVEKSGVQLRVLDGLTATETDWDHFAHFYLLTFEEKWGTPTLNAGFFKQVAQALPKQVVLVLADYQGKCIAGSLMFCSDTTLYGRHWGCTEYIDKLHFEACYYQGIEYCIQHEISLFEPGAQGEHKVARGFVPTLTRSSHWLTANPFQQAIERYVAHEQEAIADYMQGCRQHLPYK
ncbi:MAG TPA: N-acetyltransferase [Thiothrix sp.]|nr:N-acetyltransferase [Thiothrix sp.]